jgi:hypothetical protein
VERSLDGFVADIVGHPEGFVGLFARMGYLPLLPLLELPYPEVCDRLIAALTGAGVPEEAARSVSLRQLIGFALERGSPYWVGQAVGWLQAGFPFDQELAGALDRLIQEHREWPQQLRHRAFGLIRKWQRGQQRRA